MFNDTTKLILLPNQINVHFIDKEGKETYMTTTDYCRTLDKKMKLLSYFKRYMTEHLVKAGANNVTVESDQISRMPHLHSWFRTTCAVVMHLTNGSVQVYPHILSLYLVETNQHFHVILAQLLGSYEDHFVSTHERHYIHGS